MRTVRKILQRCPFQATHSLHQYDPHFLRNKVQHIRISHRSLDKRQKKLATFRQI